MSILASNVLMDTTPRPSDFMVILSHKVGFPENTVPLSDYIFQAARLEFHRVEPKEEFAEIFPGKYMSFREKVFVGKSKGGHLRVAMDMIAYLRERMILDLDVNQVRRSFSRSYPNLWLNVRKRESREGIGSDDLRAMVEVKVVQRSSVVQEHVDYVFGYPTTSGSSRQVAA